MNQVVVVDYGMGNLHSITKALQTVDTQVQVSVSSAPEEIYAADRIVFPGVGAIGDCMAALGKLDLIGVLKQVAKEKPFLGICLGLQALLEESEEGGGVACLGVLPGRVVRFPSGLRDEQGQILKIPHMGWNQVHQLKRHPLWQGIPQDSRFYFVHSYHAKPGSGQDIAAVTNYPDPFASALARDNLFAVQFHPEKSQQAGLRLLFNFLHWSP